MFYLFTGNQWRDAVISGANNISNLKKEVDELNVFPVPDGDTGTNMSMTVMNAAKEISVLEGATASKVASTVASALLRGARGNSGVITSLIFRGFSKGFKDKEVVEAEDLVNSIKSGVEGAYKAVMKPTEGTILTVARVASEYAEETLKNGGDALTVFKSMIEGAEKALAETPEILPVLKKAGVVDAGGQGLVIIFKGMLSVLENGVIIENAVETEAAPAATQNRNAAGELETDITFTYCTEYIVKRKDNSPDPSALRAYLETIGDCVVVVDDDEIIKVHVHTDHPGNAIEKALTFGQLVNLKIENMRDQHERAKHDAEGRKPNEKTEGADEEIVSAEIEKQYGMVVVSAGEGLASLFADIGADVVVSGGQTMNPSTNDILAAVEKTPAECVFVFPNNKNIIMAAEQAIPLSTRKVIVIPTSTIPQGISSMLSFDPDLDADTNAINMRRAYSNVGTGQITFAARDSEYDGKKINKGELLALANGKITFTDTNLSKAVQKLVKHLSDKNTQFVTLIYGEDVSDEDAAAVEEALREKLPSDIEITLVSGGQPVYYFIISVE